MARPAARAARKLVKRPLARPARGSRRVEAWLHGVLWPLHEALTRAAAHLEAGDLTWRHGPARLELMIDPAELVPAAGRLNLDDLLTNHPSDLPDALAAYREALGELGRRAADAQHALAAPVRDAVARAGTKGADPVSLAALAEDLINGITSREVLGAEAALWRAAAGELQGIRQAGMLGEVERARLHTLEACRNLVGAIDELRRELCDRYDLAPAPIATAHGHGHR